MGNQNKIVAGFDSSLLSAFGSLETAELTPVLQGDFVYGIHNQMWNYSFVFVITAPSVSPTAGAIYTNNTGTFVVKFSASTGLTADGNVPPAASGTLTKVSGTGDATITFSSFTQQAGVIQGTGAAIDTNVGRLRIQSGTAATGTAYITSKKIIRYRAGQGTLARFTPVFTTGVASSFQFWGVFSVVNNAIYDGYGFAWNGTAFGIAYYNAGSLAWIPQNAAATTGTQSWNGYKVDGTSGCTDDPASMYSYDSTKGSPVMIKYPFLGYGNVFFYVQNPISGKWMLVHTIKYANSSASIELSNPSLQFGGFTLSTGSTTNMTMYCGSVGLFISGSRNFISNPSFGFSNRKTAVTTQTSIFAIKNCLSYNGVINRGTIRLDYLSFAWDGANDTALLNIILNPVLGGTPAYSATSGTTADNGTTITAGNSISSFDTAGTTITGGTILYNIALARNTGISNDLTDHDIILCPGDVIAFAVTSATSGTTRVACNWSCDI
jgi:hypothetical protein